MREVKLKGIYMNNKTRDLYRVDAVGVNATNSADGQKMVRYHRYHRLHNTAEVEYYREISEFQIKFTKY